MMKNLIQLANRAIKLSDVNSRGCNKFRPSLIIRFPIKAANEQT